MSNNLQAKPSQEQYNRRVYLRITNICNKACDFCFYRNETAEKSFMSLETVERIVSEEHAKHDFTDEQLYVQLTGGEPSLHPQLDKIVDVILAHHGVDLYLETNASNLKSEKFLQLFKKYPNRIRLKISLNSELITPDSEWIENVRYFDSQHLPVHRTFMARYKDQADKEFLETIIKENNLDWKYLYPVDYKRDYTNGITNRIRSSIIYTVDGSVLVDMT